MQPLRFMTLDLRAPLTYSHTGDSPWAPLADEGERIVAFDLPGDWEGNMEPPAGSWPEKEVFVGERSNGEGDLSLERGLYCFIQLNAPPSPALVQEAARELHKEGLWQGKKMKGRLYLRVLAEEGGLVFQLLRPVETVGD